MAAAGRVKAHDLGGAGGREVRDGRLRGTGYAPRLTTVKKAVLQYRRSPVSGALGVG